MSSLQAVTASAKDWLEALARLAPVMAGRKPVPVLHAVHVDPSSGTLSAFDYEVSAVTVLADAEGEGVPFLVPYRWLLEAIRSTAGRAKGSPVKVTAEGKKVTLAARDYELHTETMEVSEYPKLPVVVASVSSAVPAGELRPALRRVSVAASTDETLPILNAVRIAFTDGALEMHATDRYRLAEDFAVGEGVGEGEFLLKARIIRALDRFLVGEEVLLRLGDHRVSIETAAVTFTVQCVDGDYPKIEALFPEKVTASFEIDRAVLLEAAKVAGLMGDRHTPCFVRMFDGGAEVTFDYGLFGPSKAPIAAGGVVHGSNEEMKFALQPRYFVAALEQLHTDKVRISYVNEVKPFLFSPEGVDGTASRITKHLIMPVRMPR
ncbi:DNA polymerase III subunit beta [Arthrobacter sp. Z1-15]